MIRTGCGLVLMAAGEATAVYGGCMAKALGPGAPRPPKRNNSTLNIVIIVSISTCPPYADPALGPSYGKLVMWYCSHMYTR